MDNLIQSGKYKDYSEIITVAINNLSVIETEISEKNSLIINGENKIINQEIFKPVEENNISKYNNSENVQNVKLDIKNIEVPIIFRLEGLDKKKPIIAAPPNDFWATGQEVPLDRWLLGHYNKLLPSKASIRAIAHLVINKKNGIVFEEAREQISKVIMELAKYLAFIDKNNNTSRDDALATAFPAEDKNLDKSITRYLNHFVANINKNGQLTGLLIDYKLINYSSGKNPKLMLTETGWKFSKLENQILDKEAALPIKKFTDEEKTFLTNHIKQNIPAEDFAFRIILEAITNNKNSPEKIDEYLTKYIGKQRSIDLSKSFLSSQRSGAMSRMVDLGLIFRIRDGVRVNYKVTDFGKQYIKQ
jgi:Arc/MetJ-type ribon-helix-helix transcriptional regulator